MKTHLKKFYNLPAIVDANILFDLHEIKGLSILNRVFSEICIPAEVVSELWDDEQFGEIQENIRYPPVLG